MYYNNRLSKLSVLHKLGTGRLLEYVGVMKMMNACEGTCESGDGQWAGEIRGRAAN